MRRHRQRLKQLSFELRYSSHDVPELKKYLAEVVRLLAEARLDPPQHHFPPNEINERLDNLETYLNTFEEFSDEKFEIERLATVVLIQNYQGYSQAASQLMSDVNSLRGEFARSNRRFELQAFWEFTVPLIVGLGSLIISVFVLLLPKLVN